MSTAELGRIHKNTTCTWARDGRAIGTGSLASRSEPSSSDADGGLSDSDLEYSNDDNKYSRGSAQGRSTTRMNFIWEAVDEQRLLAYKREDKPWDWIFRKFPGRTPAAVRTRWNMIRLRVE